MRETVVLSKRLHAVASMVSTGNRVCDVGCDHGFVPIYLIQHKISPYVLAMDVKEGPLEQAKEHIRAYELASYIETRLSDGLKAYRIEEADSLICAGMGGRLMMQILEADWDKTASFDELILQPQSEIQQFRCFLRQQGYLFADENMIEEDGKFYPMMKVVKLGKDTKTVPQGDGTDSAEEMTWRQRMEDKYGPLLLQRKCPVLKRYLEREKCVCEEILGQLHKQGLKDQKRSERYGEINRQLEDCLKVLAEIT
ncbi:MAG: class I SAM-dependent methyltransferase [Lachnospiraceae bacterium]|nr:class I SAM-dependent methyltransferase [Lachnospiraceae bacterium]